MTRRWRGWRRAAGAVLAGAGLVFALPVSVPRAAAAAAPRAVMILLDTDGHLAGKGIEAERQAVLAYLQGLPADVRAGLITFADKWHPVVPLTTDRGQLTSALAQAHARGATSDGLHGALAAARSALIGAGAARGSRLLVLSDGEELRGPALTSAVPADVVTWYHDKDDHLPPLSQLAASSGGRAVNAAEAASLGGVFGQPAAARAAKWPWSLLALLAGVFAALLAVALIGIGSLRELDRNRQLAQRMERYTARHSPAAGEEDGKVANTILGWGTRLLQSSNAEPRLALRLDLAGIRRRPAEWVVMGAAASALLAAALTVLSGNAVFGVLIGVLAGWLGMRLLLSWKIGRRQSAFSEQLPDVLQLIAGALQAGFSLPQALDGVVREGTQPAALEFSRALAETRIGIDLSDALYQIADRMQSEDLRWTVIAISIQRQVGGNLAEVLRNTVDTMRERAFLRRHVRALSAEGRLSAYILIALPILIGIWLFISNPTYMAPLFTTVLGLMMLLGGVVLMVLGSLWLRNLIKMEV